VRSPPWREVAPATTTGATFDIGSADWWRTPTYREVEARLEAAALLLSGALSGRIEAALAEAGALGLIDRAKRLLEIKDAERELAGAA